MRPATREPVGSLTPCSMLEQDLWGVQKATSDSPGKTSTARTRAEFSAMGYFYFIPLTQEFRTPTTEEPSDSID